MGVSIVRFVLQAIGAGGLLGRDAQQMARKTKLHLAAGFDFGDVVAGSHLSKGSERLLQRDIVDVFTAPFHAERGDAHVQLVAVNLGRGPIE